MSRGKPSLIALLGLLAYAGYKHRDKVENLIGTAKRNAEDAEKAPGSATPKKGFFDEVEEFFRPGNKGNSLRTGLQYLIDRFQSAGTGQTAHSWVKDGANDPVSGHELQAALGTEMVDEISEKTGLSRDEILSRLATTLPIAADALTEHGRVPTEDEAERL